MKITMSTGESIVGEVAVKCVSVGRRGEVVVDVESTGPFAHVRKDGRQRMLNQIKTAAVVKKIVDNRD